MSERCISCMRTIEGGACPHCGYPNTVSTLSHQLPVGTVLRDRYQVGKVLGQGGFGITYLAWDNLLQESVAIKEFFPGGIVQRNCAVTARVECIYTSTAEAYSRSTERFLREAQALVRFRDIPQVVDILDYLKENNTAYIVMEYVKGVDLAKYVQSKGGRLNPEEAFRILRPVMEALAKVHKGGIVHRDISPDNIILDPLGGAKLLDFGAVRAVEHPDAEKALDKSTEAILKHGFAPLEQYNSRGSLGPWTDVYAMCATVWYCLTGRVPEEASIRVMEGRDPDWGTIPGLTPAQREALAKGIACRPKDRYPDMNSLLEKLFPEEPPVKAAPAPVPPKPASVKPAPVKAAPPQEKAAGTPKKKKLWLPIAAVLALAAVLAVVLIPRLPANRYASAKKLMDSGNYAKAAALFAGLEDFEDSEKLAKHCTYRMGEELAAQGSYREAAEMFESLDTFSDSRDQAYRCRYLQAEDLLGKGQYEEAARLYADLGDYQDSPQKLARCRGELDYPIAVALLEEKDYAGAAALFETMGDFRDSAEKLALCRNWMSYESAQSYQAEGRYYDAAVLFYSLGEFEDARSQCFACWDQIAVRNTISSDDYSAAALHTDGTVTVLGLFVEQQAETAAQWQDIIAISHGNCIVGLRADGTVVYTAGWMREEWEPMSQWRDIVAISAWGSCVAGLKADGTVVTAGATYSYYDQELQEYVTEEYDVSDWTDIVATSVGWYYIAGLKSDGTVVLGGRAGYYWNGEIVPFDVSGWTDIVAISATNNRLLGLKADGTVVIAGPSGEHYGNDAFDVSGWTDIVAISASNYHAVGLKADGTVVATGNNYGGQCNVSDWTDIVAVVAGGSYKADLGFTLGVKADGTVVLAGNSNDGRYRFTGFQNVAAPK